MFCETQPPPYPVNTKVTILSVVLVFRVAKLGILPVPVAARVPVAVTQLAGSLQVQEQLAGNKAPVPGSTAYMSYPIILAERTTFILLLWQ